MSWAEDIYQNAVESGNYFQLVGFLGYYDLDHKIAGDKTGLMIAASNGHFDMVKLFLEKNVDAKLKDKNGRTALEHAATNNHLQVVELLELYTGNEWERVKTLESLINEFEYDLASKINLAVDRDSRSGLLKTISNPAYNSLRKWLLEDCVIEGDELLWFGNSKFKIAVTKTGSNPWMLNMQRVDHQF